MIEIERKKFSQSSFYIDDYIVVLHVLYDFCTNGLI